MTRLFSTSALSLVLTAWLAWAPNTAQAQDHQGWLASIDGALIFSNTSGDWDETATWDCACVPTAEDLVIILPGHSVAITGSAETSGLSVTDGASVDLQGVLTASGDVIVEGQMVGQSATAGTLIISGEGPHMLSGGDWHRVELAGEVTLAGAVSVTDYIEPNMANLHTQDALTLIGQAGFGPIRGGIDGLVSRNFDLVKTSTHAQQTGLALHNISAQSVLTQLPGISLRNWVESATGYALLQDVDTINASLGLMFSGDTGAYNISAQGQVQAASSFEVTYTDGFWPGFHHLSNPLTATIDWNSDAVERGPVKAATYAWSDEYNTYMAQVAGYGSFGHNGTFAPGAPFWVTASAAGSLEIGVEAAVDPVAFSTAAAAVSSAAAADVIAFQIASETATEQTVLVAGAGSGDYDSEEDAVLNALFRGKNYLDIFTTTTDSVQVMVNLMEGAPGSTVPLWIKASEGTGLTLTLPVVASARCVLIEDLVTGQLMAAAADLEYDFVSFGSADTHRFDIHLGADLAANAQGASCAVSADGSVTASVTGAAAGIDPSAWALVDSQDPAAGSIAPDSTTANEAFFTAQSVGSYRVELAPGQGCPMLAVPVAVVAEGAAIEVEATVDHIGCNDTAGTVELSIEGGTAPFNVDWAHGPTGLSLHVLQAGTYDAVVSDAQGCSTMLQATVQQAPPVEAVIYLDTAVVNLIDGEVEIIFGNATAGATNYHWDFGDGSTSTDPIPTHVYTAADYYVVALNAWNDLCSDTYQAVLTVQVGSVNSIDHFDDALIQHANLTRDHSQWWVEHPSQALTLELFDLTGRLVSKWSLEAGEKLALQDSEIPRIALLRATETGTTHVQTWKLGHR